MIKTKEDQIKEWAKEKGYTSIYSEPVVKKRWYKKLFSKRLSLKTIGDCIGESVVKTLLFIGYGILFIAFPIIPIILVIVAIFRSDIDNYIYGE